MQIFVKVVIGKRITLDVEASDTPDDVREKIQETEDTDFSEHRLIFEGRQVEDGDPLSGYKIQKGRTLQVKRISLGDVMTELADLRRMMVRLISCRPHDSRAWRAAGAKCKETGSDQGSLKIDLAEAFGGEDTCDRHMQALDKQP